MNKIYQFCRTVTWLFAFLIIVGVECNVQAQVSLTATGGTSTGTFVSINDAFTAINAGTHTGAIVISINGNTTEPTAVPLSASGQGTASYTSILIQPTVVAIVSSAVGGGRGMLEFNGADNVTINGNIAGSTATTATRDLTFDNTAANTVVATAVIRYIGGTTGGLGATNNTIRNCIVSGNTPDGATANSTLNNMGICAGGTTISGTTAGADFDNLTVVNNEVRKAYYGIYVGSAGGANFSDNMLITNNLVGNATATLRLARSGIFIYGGANGGRIAENEVTGIANAGFVSIAGIEFGGGVASANVEVSRNKIYNIAQSSTSGYGAAGIRLGLGAGTNVLITNNVIYDIRTLNYNSTGGTFQAYGILLNGGTGHKVYYNSIHLFGSYTTGTSIVVAFSACLGVNLTSITGIDVRNNIFANKMTSAAVSTPLFVGIWFATGYVVTNTTNVIMDNNAYFVPPTGAGYHVAKIGTTAATNNFTTVAAWKTATNQNNSSIPTLANLNAPFTSDTDLTIPTGTSTELESGGVVITPHLPNPNIDYTGANRPVTPGLSPDMGAYEFNGVILDLGAPIITHTAPANTCTSGSRTITANITDTKSPVPTTGAGLPVAYWRIGAGAYQSAIGVSMGAGMYQFTVGTGSVSGDVISYYIVAQDGAATPNVAVAPTIGAAGLTANPPTVATPPTTLFSYTNLGVLAGGTYTVGLTGNYTTLTAAVNDYNAKCLGGAVTFLLIDATYPTETFPITVNSNPSASAVNTLTIKPQTGVNPTLTGSNVSAIIRLNGADFVTLDGSNTAGGTTRDWTVSNTNTGTSSAVIWVNNASTTDAALNNAIINLTLQGNSGTTTAASVIVGGSAFGTPSDVPNNNLSVVNNRMLKAQNGVFASGNATTPDQNWTFNNNTIGATAVADQPFRGMLIQNAQNVVINNNQISGISTTTTNTSTGINLRASISGVTISNNTISNIRNTNTTGYGSNGIQLNSSNVASNVNIFNNIISDVASNGYASGWSSTDNGYGIMVDFGGGYNIYYNTVILNTNQPVAGNTAPINIATAITSLNVRNNIFINTQTTGTRYAIYSLSANTAFTNINYNDYFFAAGGGVGFLGAAQNTLTAWQTATGQDANSLSTNPLFVSATNFTPTSCLLDNRGVNIVGITTDNLNATRSTTTPDLGAIEFTSTNSIATVITPATGALTAGVAGTAYMQALTQTVYPSVIWTIQTGTLPAGLAINATTGQISGTPTTPGTSNFTVRATSGGCFTDIVYSITITCPTITVTPATLSNGAVNVAYTAQLISGTATGLTGAYSVALTTGSVAGMSVVANSWQGTPTATGSYNLTFTVTHIASGCSTTQNYTFVVDCANVTFNPTTFAAATVGTAVNPTITQTGAVAPFAWSISAGAIPTGLTFTGANDANTATLTGTPTTAGTYNFTVSINLGGCSVSQAYTWVVNCPNITINPATLTPPTINVAYNQVITATGNTAPIVWSLSAGVLPTGLTFDVATATISGTPAQSGNFPITITATQGTCIINQNYTISLACPNTVITPTNAALPQGTANTPYPTINFTQTGLAGLVTWSVIAGTLPPGITIATDGTFAGTPTLFGNYTFTVGVTQGVNLCSASKQYNVQIISPCTFMTPAPPQLPVGNMNTVYTSTTMTTTGGLAPYTYAVSNGALPAGLTLTTAGVLSGTPTAQGVFNVNITATDANGCKGSITHNIVINAACTTINFTNTSLVNGTIGILYNQPVVVTGGVAPYTFSLVSGTLPAGLQFTPGGVVAGTPSVAGTSSFTVKVTDAIGCFNTQLISVTINAVPSSIITVSGALNFGSVVLGQTAILSFDIQNTGNAPLNITGISYPAGYTGSFIGTLLPGATQTVTVIFSPNAIGNFNGTVTVASNAGSGTSTLPISGVGIAGTTTAINEDTKPQVSVYPNPTTDFVDVKFENGWNGKYDVRVFDANGKGAIVEKADIADLLRLDFRNLSNGIYFLQLETKKGKTTVRVVKN